MKRSVFLVTILALFACSHASGQEIEKVLSGFRDDLSKVLLGSVEPVKDDVSGFWQSVQLAPIGSPWSLASADGDVQSGIFKASSIAKRYNFPVGISNGVVAFNRGSGFEIETTWARILTMSTPVGSLTSEEGTADVLFKKTDRIDTARGLVGLEPSSKLLKYKEFESAHNMLSYENARDKGAWRLHPRFHAFATIAEAKQNLESDWELFGYRNEIEAALEQRKKKEIDSGRAAWKAARRVFYANTSNRRGVRQGLTHFFPREQSWQSMPNWTTAVFMNPDGTETSCQIAIIEIERPWLDLSLLTNAKFRLRESDEFPVISNGADPSTGRFPKGVMANLIKGLIVVRAIQEFKGETYHPLGRYQKAPAQTINLLGFVVESLPKIQAKSPIGNN